jgi:hypothetical protein
MQPQPNLAEQLSRSSMPYRDPVADIPWEALARKPYWLPPEAISLHGVPAFMALPESQRQRLSQYEFLNFIEGGIWLEGIFMERIARSTRAALDRQALKYRVHELREEAGHTLMFLELMERSGLAATPMRHPRLVLADLFGRYAPLESLAFWMAMVVGEEVPDRLNRYIRAHSDEVSPTITAMCTLHMVDEARHIAYARVELERRIAGLGSWRRTLLTPVMRKLIEQFVSVFYYPAPAVYTLAGLSPAQNWAALARNNPHRTAFVQRTVDPTLQLLRQHGFAITWPNSA